jgi:SAM-dependent methyltransferase
VTANEEREYVLGTDPAELERLGLQHRAWRAQAYDHWERAGFAPGQSLLDVGCGPGFATLDLARVVGTNGRVTAVDVSRRFLDRLGRAATREELANVTLVESDVQKLSLDAGHDGAWCRWLLMFTPDPGAVIGGVARALKPGGTFAIQEYVSYGTMKLGPRGGACARVVAAIVESFRSQGGDPDVALRLPELLEKNGLVVRDMRPISRIARPGTSLWEWPASFFEVYVPKLVEAGHLDKETERAFFAEWKEHERNPDALFLAPTVLALTATKTG